MTTQQIHAQVYGQTKLLISEKSLDILDIFIEERLSLGDGLDFGTQIYFYDWELAIHEKFQLPWSNSTEITNTRYLLEAWFWEIIKQVTIIDPDTLQESTGYFIMTSMATVAGSEGQPAGTKKYGLRFDYEHIVE